MKHSELVKTLLKPGIRIACETTASKANLTHIALGISGEAGELLDAIKKHAIYNKPLDRDNIIEELGDMEFFLEALRQALKIRRSTTIKANIKKLNVRYATKQYTDSAAQTRADKI